MQYKDLQEGKIYSWDYNDPDYKRNHITFLFSKPTDQVRFINFRGIPKQGPCCGLVDKDPGYRYREATTEEIKEFEELFKTEINFYII